MIVLEIFSSILGIILFLLPGLFLSYVLFPKSNAIERLSFSLLLSYSTRAILNFSISFLGINSAISFLLWIIIIAISIFLASKKRGLCKTFFDTDSLYILLLSFIGFGLKLWFYIPMENYGECYSYASSFARGIVPNLGFYTGMALDHSNYLIVPNNEFFSFIGLERYIGMFFAVIAHLGFIYMVFKEYGKKNTALWAVALFSTVPIELFKRVTLDQAIISFIFSICLFMLFRRKDRNFLIFCIIVCFALCISSYTATIVTITLCSGFILALIIKTISIRKKFTTNIFDIFKNRKIWGYTYILIISLSLLLLLSDMFSFTVGRIIDTSFVKYAFNQNLEKEVIAMHESPNINIGEDKLYSPEIVKEFSIQNTINSFQNNRYLGLSVMGWQSVFFLLCGASFAGYIIKIIFKKERLSTEDIDILYAIIPVLLLGLAFAYVNYPARIFVYLSFFSILALHIPKKIIHHFFAISFILLLISTTFVIQEQRMFSNQPDGEVSAALDIKNQINGIIFTDQCFVNQLVLNGYYKVTGTNDKNPILNSLYYSQDKDDFLNAINTINLSGAPYIATTKRMREKFILMVDFQIKPLFNEVLYEKYLEKIYDNGDVMIFSTDIIENKE